MQYLATASDYVERWGVVETGRLLVNQRIIDESTADTKAGYQAAIYSGSTLVSAVSDYLTTIVEEAQSIVQASIESYVGYPVIKDGFVLTTAEIKDKVRILHVITLDIARYILHDEDIDEEENVYNRYKRSLSLLDDIATGSKKLEVGQGTGEAPTVWAI